MRLAINHLITCRFTGPANGSMQTLRMEPRGLAGQFIESWRLDVSADCLLKPVIDPYGNVTHTFALAGPLETVTFQASGIVSTEDTVGVVTGLSERLPHALYLRDTALTKPTASIRALAAEIAAAAPSTLERLHALMDRLADTITLEPPPTPATPCPNAKIHAADAVLAAGRGDAIAMAHLFVATARALDLPARFVTGYILAVATPDKTALSASPSTIAAWSEVWCDGVGWIGFDAPRRECPTESYVRLAAGPDLRDAEPLRLAAYGAELAEVTTTITVADCPAW